MCFSIIVDLFDVAVAIVLSIDVYFTLLSLFELSIGLS